MKQVIAFSLLAALTVSSTVCTLHTQEPRTASAVRTDEPE